MNDSGVDGINAYYDKCPSYINSIVLRNECVLKALQNVENWTLTRNNISFNSLQPYKIYKTSLR